MESLLIYILKSSAVLTLFMALFVALMQQETYHRLNRFTLLATTVLALALPCINLGIETPLSRLFAEQKTEGANITMVYLEDIAPMTAAIPTPQTAESDIEWLDIIFAIYIAGIVLLLARQAFMYVGLTRIIKKGVPCDARPYTDQNIRLRVIDDEDIRPFSWFHWVVINRKDLQENGQEIITHETAHSRSLHSLDIIFVELLILVQWFNPMAWFTKLCIKNIHEYEADEAVIRSGTDIDKYQQMIIKKAVGARLYSIANSFNHSSTIKRITMMCKKKSNLWRCTKALYILPAATIAALLFSQPESINATEQQSDGKVTEFVANKQVTTPANAPSDSTAKRGDVMAVGEVKHTQPNDTAFVYMVVEEQPRFPGGERALMKFLQHNIKYPVEARNANVQGRCYVTFVVDKQGNIKDARVQKSSGSEALDKESVRVVESMPQWLPGKQGGKNVAVQYTLPIMFRLQGTPQSTAEELKSFAGKLHKKAEEQTRVAVRFLEKGDTAKAQEELRVAQMWNEEAMQSMKKATDAASPLLIINGAIYEGKADIIANLKEEDIESINILQPEAATQVFGSRGENGVIAIKLKEYTFHYPNFITEENTANDKPVKEFQFNVGVGQKPNGQEKYDTPAEFIGRTEELQLGNLKAVVESGLTEGSVTLEFNVETDGTITFAKVKESSGNNFIDSSALTRLYNTQQMWKPATRNGQPVRSRPVLTLTFSKKR